MGSNDLDQLDIALVLAVSDTSWGLDSLVADKGLDSLVADKGLDNLVVVVVADKNLVVAAVVVDNTAETLVVVLWDKRWVSNE